MKRTKFLLITLALLLCSMTTNAIPVRPGQWATLTLADGTTVRAEVFGNEYGCWFQDAQGRYYVRQGECYVETDWETIAARRKASMAARHVGARRALFSTTISGLGTKGRCSGGAMYSVGEYSIPVLMVEFSDMKFSQVHTTALIQDYLTKEGFQYTNPNTLTTHGVGSIRDYFVAQSKGMFKPNFKLLGKVTLDKSYRYYGQHNPNNDLITDMRANELPGDAMRAAVAQIPGVDFKQFVVQQKDEYHETGIPLICILYAGESETNHSAPPDYQPDLLWPHQNIMTTKDRYITGADVYLNSYFVGNEISGDGKSLEGIGTFVHELGHSLGLPDWYCTNGSYNKDDAFGAWSVMDNGCYVNKSWTPIGYTAYERSYMGWWDVPTYTESGHYKLAKPYDENDCAVFYINGDVNYDTEYFIIESRYPSLWYPAQAENFETMPPLNYGSGLLLSRYAYNQTEWFDDRPNNIKDAKRGLMITADGKKLYYSANQSNLFGNGVNTISGQRFLSGKTWNATISNITKNSDGSIEFDLDLGETGIKTVDNSQLAVDVYYDLQGRRVDNPSKGIYIKNGKKKVISF